MFVSRYGVRARVLAIALIPSVGLLTVGVGVSTYMVEQGLHARSWAAALSQSIGPGGEFVAAMQEERRLTMLRVAGAPAVADVLSRARTRLDRALLGMESIENPMQTMDPGAVARGWASLTPLLTRLPVVRGQVDTDGISFDDAYRFYGQLTELTVAGIDTVERTAPDVRTSLEESKAREAFGAADAMSQAFALLAPAVVDGKSSPAQFQQFVTQAGYYRAQVDRLATELSAGPAAALTALTSGAAWQQVNSTVAAVTQQGLSPLDAETGTGSQTMDLGMWLDSSGQLSRQMLAVYAAQEQYALHVASQAGDRIARDSLAGGGLVLLVALGVFAVALRISNRLIRRLKELRRDTLALADEQLPRLMDRLKAGHRVDLDSEVRHLEYGDDEIGQVGHAFNRAQRAAMAAAVTEAGTREGVKAVFLNIAHRSQLVTHRQLEILDNAEYHTEDPATLAVLFQLDHLATRERRNAENLIILGGERPGRRWRNPVPLTDVVRSAVAEAQQYERVRVGNLPPARMMGAAVADLIHLLAELVDNATTFSPPESRVDIRSGVVGHGVAVEICDQGLGMTADQIASVNDTLRNPPNFSVHTLSSDSRLGLFVVAQLADRHKISIRLTESDYGGIRAIIVIPHAIIAPTEQAPSGADTGPRHPSRTSADDTHLDTDTYVPQAGRHRYLGRILSR